ncbi:MAG: hypothetical protein IPH75_15050 [bacterium]|nr:hypothetical protein [bacterium]
MKTKVWTLVSMLLAGSASAQDAPTVVLAPAQPLLMTILLLAAAVGCVVFCIQVFTLVRGGQLSKSWLFFGGAFLLLAVSQTVILLAGFGVIMNNPWFVPGLLTAMTGLFIWGLLETKKALS